MKAVLFFFPENLNLDLPEWLRHKSERFYCGINAALDKSVHLLAMKGEIPVAPVSTHPLLPSFLQGYIRNGQACILTQLRSLFVLDADERFVSEEFSYLSHPYQHFAAGTVVLTYTTTYGTYYMIFPEITIEKPSKKVESAQGLVGIKDEGRLLYPLPMEEPSVIATRSTSNGCGYTITKLDVKSTNTLSFKFEVPDDPLEGSEWWGLYRGAMPSWTNLDKYIKWNWLSTKSEQHHNGDTVTVNDLGLQSHAIYTFALFKWKWDLMDYIEFTAP